ncbi:zinc-binding dehydrogenase [Mycobacterium vicinigordonae]|uniref:Zinc-binding dehydrogenase n=1 Tax=Mycobacterium vicinigordonae TaxID=1719132 RepID=A0A7D6HU88_9MYCO|nr:zinc-binding dehydrogenase [Mycobacterium vicinigordonae]QLL07572.1 zinc-binding dehydrogenase [Mycobacterium vicinigordonae]
MSDAAVCTAAGADLRVEQLFVAPPRRGEVKVRIGATGLCGSDRSAAIGAMPCPMPMVLGHQGAGIVTAVGDGVDSVRLGDRVVIIAITQCHQCYECARSRPHLCRVGLAGLTTGLPPAGTSPLRDAKGNAVRQFMAAGTFADEIVVPATSAIPIPFDMPFVPAALIGCSGLTGFGAAVNTASIEPGYSVAVIGCGAVGLFAIQGARLVGAGEIVAIDVAKSKLELAKSLGADDVIDGSTYDSVACVRQLTANRGADVVIEAVGSQVTVDQAIRMTARGGHAVFVGAGSPDTMVAVRQYSGLIAPGVTLRGCFLGSADARRDVPRLVRHYLAGDLQIDPLVSQRITLGEVNQGLASLGGPNTVTSVIDFQQEPSATESLRSAVIPRPYHSDLTNTVAPVDI